MRNNSFLKNYKKITMELITACFLISLILFAVLYYGYEIKDKRIMLIVIPSLASLIATTIIISLIPKKIIEFVRKESTLKHPLPSKITREQVIQRLKDKGFNIYSVDNMQLGLQLVNQNKKLTEISYCYAFLILDETMDEEKIAIENKELREITYNYFKEKKMYRYTIFRPIFCFWGEQFSDKIIEKCRKGIDLRKGMSQISYIGYETYSKTLYYAEAIEQLLDLRLGDFKMQIQWIKEIFQVY